jgi:hypothetical protein
METLLFKKDPFIRFPAVIHEPKLKHRKLDLMNMGGANNITKALDYIGYPKHHTNLLVHDTHSLA